MWGPVTFYYQTSLSELQATSQASGYDPTNMLGGFEMTSWKATGPTSQTIASDAGTGHLLTVDYFSMGAHNLKTAGASVIFQYANWPFFSDWTQLEGTTGVAAKSNHAAAVVNSEMFIFGGFEIGADRINDLWKYNAYTNAWTSCTSGCSARSQTSMVAIGNELFVYGGISRVNSGNSILNDCWKYNTITGSWTQVASGIRGRYAHAAAVCSGEMYVFGGYSLTGNSYQSDLIKYNPSSNTWTEVQCHNIGRVYHSMVAIGSKLYVFAGYTPVNNPTRDCWRFDCVVNSWTACSSNPDPTYNTAGHAAVAVNSEMFTFGGVSSVEPNRCMWRYSPSSDSWTVCASASFGRKYHSMVAIGNLLIVHAGILTNQYSYQNDTWTTTGMRLAADSDITTVVSGFIPDEDAITLKTWDTPISARAWRIQINTPAAVPYIGFARWGKKTELDYLDVKVDPGKRKRHANVNVSQTGYLQGVWEYYTEREIDCSFTAAQSSLYQRVSDWYDIHGMKNFVMQWEPTSHSTETWIVRADPELGAPMYAGGNYRDIKFVLRGRKA